MIRSIGVVLTVLLLSTNRASAVDIFIEPDRAMGVEGEDWIIGPDPSTITLFTTPTRVQLRAYMEGFDDVPVAAYGIGLDCDSRFFDVQGRVFVITTNCSVGAGVFDVDFCMGINESDPSFVLANSSTVLSACDNTCPCPDNYEGCGYCDAVSIVGNSGPDLGLHYYLGEHGFDVSTDARGEANINFDPSPFRTWVKDSSAEDISIESVTPARIIIGTGACCGVGVGATGCQVLTKRECEDLGGQFLMQTECANQDADNDGVDDACDPCLIGTDNDTDGDGLCDSIDPCPLDFDNDSDNDTVCNSDDVCPGVDDTIDNDNNGIPDCAEPVPAMGQWGLGILILLLLVCGKLSQRHRALRLG